MGRGKVYLVGAGPGEPKLLTLRALEIMRAADVVVYDRLVSKAVLDLIPERAVKLYAGKAAGHNCVPQEEINKLMISKAKDGYSVVRLKGGDPFLFARGGEEAQELRTEGVDFEVVPGVSSALAVPAYAGIPLTHRRLSSSFAIVTGHEAPLEKGSRVNWSKLASSVDTIVILMGVTTLPKASRELMAGGLSPETPVAAIEWGTTEKQRTVLFTLSEAAEGKALGQINPPSVIVVGEVAALAKELNWFNKDHPDVLMGIMTLVQARRQQKSS